MGNSGFAVLIFVMVAVVGVLAAGVFSMVKGGDFNRRNANKLMRARVLLRGVALLVFALLMLFLNR